MITSIDTGKQRALRELPFLTVVYFLVIPYVTLLECAVPRQLQIATLQHLIRKSGIPPYIAIVLMALFKMMGITLPFLFLLLAVRRWLVPHLNTRKAALTTKVSAVLHGAAALALTVIATSESPSTSAWSASAIDYYGAWGVAVILWILAAVGYWVGDFMYCRCSIIDLARATS